LANSISRAYARAVFDKRSRKGYRNVEVHLSEAELAAIIEGAVLDAMNRVKREVEEPTNA
jgi:hypothetical protein